MEVPGRSGQKRNVHPFIRMHDMRPLFAVWWKTICERRRLAVGMQEYTPSMPYRARCRDKCNFMSQFSSEWKHYCCKSMVWYTHIEPISPEILFRARCATYGHVHHVFTSQTSHAWRTFIQLQTVYIIIVCFDTEGARRLQTKWKISNDNDQHQMDLMPSNVRNKIIKTRYETRASTAGMSCRRFFLTSRNEFSMANNFCSRGFDAHEWRRWPSNSSKLTHKSFMKI